MTEICLVRHGQTDWNFQEIIQGREDIPLNETGRQQARQSAQMLCEQSWDVIVSSPLVRAYETAKEIAEAVGIEKIHLEERIIERDFGAASGKPVRDVRHLIASGEVDGMETDDELVKRCFMALEEIAKRHNGKRIIVVAHAHAIKAMLHAIAPEKVTFQTFLKNACLNYVGLQDGAWHIQTYNVVAQQAEQR